MPSAPQNWFTGQQLAAARVASSSGSSSGSRVLGDMFKEWLEMFDTDVLHMGGDEVNFDCWRSEKEFKDYMEKNNKARNYCIRLPY